MKSLSASDVINMAQGLSKFNLLESGPPDVQWRKQLSVSKLTKMIDQGVPHLPMEYVHAYIEPLRRTLPKIVEVMKSQGNQVIDPAASLCGVVCDHAPGSEVDSQLRRFNVVIADFYQTFLAKEKRSRLGLQMIESLPPLATFRSQAELGPFTYSADNIASMTGSNVGVVSLPSAYRDLPILWLTLAHETGGHDVIHADKGLLAQIESSVAAMFADSSRYWNTNGNTEHAKLLAEFGVVWKYWVNETAADVFALLNTGPSFVLNLAAWLSAWLAQLNATTFPAVRSSTIGSNSSPLDSHPTDVLRLYVAMGVIDNMLLLHPSIRSMYVNLLNDLTKLLCPDVSTVTISGVVPTDDPSKHQEVNIETSLEVAGDAARMVGRLISSTRYPALAGQSIQDIETWSTADEKQCLTIAMGFAKGELPSYQFSPMYLLAGATIAVLAGSADLDRVTSLLNMALDRCIDADPLWGRKAFPGPDSPYNLETPVFKKVLQ